MDRLDSSELGLGPELLDILENPKQDRERLLLLVGRFKQRYDERPSGYHGWAHPLELLGLLLEHQDKLHNPRVVAWAMLGHDIVQHPRHGNAMNVKQSAALCADLLWGYLPNSELNSVGTYIHATNRHYGDPADADLMFLLDADLAILGAPPERYAQYCADVTTEYAAVEPQLFRDARIAILSSFLDRERIYQTDFMYHAYEAQARANMTAEIELLQTT